MDCLAYIKQFNQNTQPYPFKVVCWNGKSYSKTTIYNWGKSQALIKLVHGCNLSCPETYPDDDLDRYSVASTPYSIASTPFSIVPPIVPALDPETMPVKSGWSVVRHGQQISAEVKAPQSGVSVPNNFSLSVSKKAVPQQFELANNIPNSYASDPANSRLFIPKPPEGFNRCKPVQIAIISDKNGKPCLTVAQRSDLGLVYMPPGDQHNMLMLKGLPETNTPEISLSSASAPTKPLNNEPLPPGLVAVEHPDSSKSIQSRPKKSNRNGWSSNSWGSNSWGSNGWY